MFMTQAIQGSYAEIGASQLALKKADRADVKDFAQAMIRDHEKMAKEATMLAEKKGYTAPDGPSAQQHAELVKLDALSGQAFDTMYVQRIAVAAHEETVKLFETASKEVRDPDIQAMIGKTLPTLRDHLKMAQALAATAILRGGS
jgi:putative membrane protein